MHVQRSRTRNARRHSMDNTYYSGHDNQTKTTPYGERNIDNTIQIENKNTVSCAELMHVQRSRTRDARRHSMGDTYSDYYNQPKPIIHRERNVNETIEYENEHSDPGSRSMRVQRSRTRSVRRHSMSNTYSDHDDQPKSASHCKRNYYETIEFESEKSVASPGSIRAQGSQARSMRRHSMGNTYSDERHYTPEHHPSQSPCPQRNGSRRRKGIHNRYLSRSNNYERAQQRTYSKTNERATRIKCSSMVQFSGFTDDFYAQHGSVKYDRARRRLSL